MFVIRPVQASDLAGLLALAGQTSFGLTTLPKDADWLAGRIRDSEDAFRRLADRRPRGEAYLFVLEDTSTGRVLGTAGTSQTNGTIRRSKNATAAKLSVTARLTLPRRCLGSTASRGCQCTSSYLANCT